MSYGFDGQNCHVRWEKVRFEDPMEEVDYAYPVRWINSVVHNVGEYTHPSALWLCEVLKINF